MVTPKEKAQELLDFYRDRSYFDEYERYKNKEEQFEILRENCVKVCEEILQFQKDIGFISILDYWEEVKREILSK